MNGLERFSESHLDSIKACLQVAEDCLGRFYRFSPREWFHFSFEILTMRDLPPDFPPRHPAVFGETVRHPDRIILDGTDSQPKGCYSIILFDENILAHLHQAPQTCFEHLLLYILTHELVHVARFHHLMESYQLPDAERDREERLVHRLTGAILAQLPDVEIGSLAARYSSEEFSM